MVTDPGFSGFEDFWPHYLRRHSKKSTRLLHVLGTGAALGAAAVGLTGRRRRWLLLVAPALAYGPAWLGHALFERSWPTSFRHPLWSARAGMRMFVRTLAGTLDEELDALGREPRGSRATGPTAPSNEGNGAAGRASTTAGARGSQPEASGAADPQELN